MPFTLTGFGSSEAVSIRVNNVEVTQISVPAEGGVSGSFVMPAAKNGNNSIAAVGISTGNSSTEQFSVQPTLTLGNNWVAAGGSLSNALSGFGASENVSLVLSGGVNPAEGSPVDPADTTLRTIQVAANGSSPAGPGTNLVIPANVAPGVYTIAATGTTSGASSTSTIEVIASNAETPTASTTPTITRTPTATPTRTPTRTPTASRTPTRTATPPNTVIGIGSIVQVDGMTNVRTGPCTSYGVIYTAPDNTQFSVLSLGQVCGDYTWIRVRQTSAGSNQGTIGYLAAQNVDLIATATPTRTPSPIGPSRTPTPTRTATVTRTPTVSVTPSQSVTPSFTPTVTRTPTASSTPTATLTPSQTGTATQTATSSSTATASNTATATATRTATLPATHTSTATISPTRTPTRTATPIGGFGAGDIVQVNEPLNMRSGPGTGFSVIVTLASGNRLLVTGTGTPAGGFFWIPVGFGGNTGWVASQYVTKVGVATPTRTSTPTRTASPSRTPTITGTAGSTQTATPTRTPSPSRTPSITRTPGATLTSTASVTPIGGYSNGDIARVTEDVNLRNSPSLFGGVLRVLQANDQLLVTGTGVSADGHLWIPVRFGSTNGWVTSLYITKIGTSTPTVTRTPVITATRTVSATPSRTATGGPTFTPGPGGFLPGDIGHTRVRVNLRTAPGTSATMIQVLTAGTELQVTGYGQPASGYFWLPVETLGGTAGWVADDFLTAERFAGSGEHGAVIATTVPSADCGAERDCDDANR